MSAPVSFIECVSKMAYTRVLSCVMLALISSIIASIQLNHAIIDIQENYKRRRLNLSRLLSTTTSTFTRVKRLRCRRESKERRFWTRPGRTSAWWNNFADQVVIPEEWKENFRMSRDSLYNLAEELRPYIQEKATNMRSPVGVVKQVACGDLTTWTLTLDNKALKQRLQAQIDSACAFGVWHRFMRLRAFSCGRVKTLRKRWSFSCGRR